MSLFHPENELQPTYKILFGRVWLKDKVYTTPSLSVNGPVEVAIMLNE